MRCNQSYLDGTSAVSELHVERYKFILQQLHSLNENVYKILGIYQSLSTVLAGAGVALFVGYRKWELSPELARSGMIGIATLLTIAASFTILLIVVGMVSWFDYRNEEYHFLTEVCGLAFRSKPSLRNIFRWYEPHVIGFIIISTLALWMLVVLLMLPVMK
ncbi:hypothetical protein AB0K25_24610 [Micromonospora sp. NPDC049257]|uniref:hypothetical protein n=1 Tax=Micromonospora sp. NPDC049257 TaxID=3155771 RepID=UPI003444EDA8